MSSYNDLYNRYMNEANEYASAYGLDPATQHNGSWDAFRHAYSSAAMANEFGADVADAAGWLNELRGDLLHDQPAWEKNMDLWNNSVGREIGTNSNSKDEMAQKVFDALNKGDLINDPLNDDRLYDSFFPKNFNPDDHSTIPSKMQDLLNPKIDPDVNDLWHAFKNWVAPRVDPLVLDLDGDGIETLGINATTHVVFDYESDGLKTGTGWIKGDDGFLVLDRNGNGTIDNGGELFGDQTSVNGVKATDGFSALSGEDTDHDGAFDANDANYANVRVWQDVNSDGISQTSELHTLSELGIASINLDSTISNSNLNGNTETAVGTYTKSDGTTATVGNLNFTENPFYREFTNEITLTETALTLPDMQGSGMVRDLREASTLSAGLTSTLQSMSTTYETRDQMMAQIDTLLAQWAETSSMATSVQMAEAINNDILVYLPTQSSADFQLYFDMMFVSGSGGNGASSVMLDVDFERYQTLLLEQAHVTAMINTLERFNGETFVTIEPDNVIVTGSAITMSITPPDTYGGGGSNAVLPYQFVGLSATQVSFLEQSYQALKQSVYDGLVLQTRLGGYMDAVNLTIDETGIHIDDSEMMGMLTSMLKADSANAMADMLEINKYAGVNFRALGWNGDGRVSDMLAASDGIYDATALFASYGMTIADGAYTGTVGNDVVWGKQRDDIIDAGEGDNSVYGGAGSDRILTGTGTDTINGGEGDDLLEGGQGNDTYFFSRGDGKDVVYDGAFIRGSEWANNQYNNWYNAGNDTLTFGTGISANDVVAKTEGNNLILALKEEGKTFDQLSNTITLENWYNVNNRIENIAFADGTILSGVSAIFSLIATEGEDVINWNESELILDAQGGNDTITSLIGNSTINGGAGNDTITTGDWNDSISGGEGDDVLIGGYGNDLYFIDSLGDFIVENTDEGIDTVNASLTYTLGLNLENLILSGVNAINGTGNMLDNILTGNKEINILDGGIGADTMIGGAGNDTYIVDNVGDITTEGTNAGTDTVQSSVSYTLSSNVENLTLTGSSTINGTGNSSSNTIIGNGANNSIDGKSGADTMIGGLGNDTYVVDNVGDSVIENLSEGTDTVKSSISYILATNLENLTLTGTTAINATGNTLNNTLTGNSGANVLNAGKGKDTLNGAAGNDTYFFNLGDGIDSISDSAGSDTLAFGTGIDKGNVAVFKSGSNLILSYGATDTITIINQSLANNAIEKVTLADGNYLTLNDMNVIIQSMNAYATDHGMSITSLDNVKANQDLMNIVAGAWHK